LCGNKGSRTVAEGRHEVERRPRIQITNSRNIRFRFCKRSGDSEKCERKQYIPVWSAIYTAQYNAKNCGTFGIRSHKQCARHVVHERIIESLGLQVQLPMILEVDNKGAVGLVNNYSVGGRTRHVET
jgi:hypothetical protein